MKQIKNVTVLGSGTMGMGIAAQFANIGCEVLLLDIVPPNLDEKQKSKKSARNSFAAGALKAATKSRMNPFYSKDFAARIAVGNFEDDFEKIANSDIIIEVVIENLAIKKQVFEKVDKYRKEGSIVASNTSSIPISLMKEGRSDDFRKNFLGLHFFNPVRHMDLLEVIPTDETSASLVSDLMVYGRKTLGKVTVLCKDTPAFIANRFSVASGIIIEKLTEELDLTIEEVDAILGKPIGRPKTGFYRLQDLIGIDVNEKVMDFMVEACPKDELIVEFANRERQDYIKWLLENKALGDKTKKGYYQKTVTPEGKKQLLAFNLKTQEYAPVKEVTIASLATKGSLKDRLASLLAADDKGGEFARRYFGEFFAYISNRIPEVSDNIYSIDDAMKAGYAWEVGPFEYWDLIGGEKGLALAKAEGKEVASWAADLISSGKTFYNNNGADYFNSEDKNYQKVEGRSAFASLGADKAPVYQNEGVKLHDIGDGVLCLEFISKANAISVEVTAGILEAIRIAEENGWKGIVIGNNTKSFSVGANLVGVAESIEKKDFKAIELACGTFQKMTSAIRLAKVPVVAAVKGYALGGGAEIMMHSDAAVAAYESYIGLPEASVGLLPGGGGTKEMAVQLSDGFFFEDVKVPKLIAKFNQLAMSKVAGSAFDAQNMGYIVKNQDMVVGRPESTIEAAKQKVLALSYNYVAPVLRERISVMGQGGLAAIYTFINTYQLGNYFSEHDALVAKKIAWILCGGDLSGAQEVSEKYLLELELEGFVSLATEPKTFERIKHMLKTGKPLRN
ncbi:3-hydroxyacyl-CoA dehydrogenase [Tenacibaculum holothuriorum]|uniref:3-hydroxyacyl-CoA dehydrogenase n=1 Tax=Tenacibaculum holothuriorum TaxID=1635173 RepID=A0A1Y2PAB6_9FLAO|nr:3-hydroxyacyl-CoA dehydrogenase/enoyl-CoA hydratase family protein [Tenacibaculum holothuriorum]OSY87396.1 3-hydroxyacyl-CoA dehydrogenase [Tenacibaculum holothuriorum]